MTISLLRRIWQRIHVDSNAAPPRQRLTGFEPLEPRMVLSGFMAFYTPDYFSPPPGDFAHVDRSGAEIALPSAAFGDYPGNSSFGRALGKGADDDRLLDGHGNDNWLSVTPYGLPLNSSGSYESPQSSIETSETSYDIDEGTSSSVSIINIPPVTSSTSITYISISPLAIDYILADLRPVTSSASFAFTPMATTSNMSPMSSSFRSLTDRDYTPVNAGGAVDRHEDAHDYAATHGSASNASLALATRPAVATVDYGATNTPADAALASQAMGTVNSAIAPSTDGSSANGQSGAASNASADHAQTDLLELTGGERLKLKRKVAGLTAETDEESTSATAQSDQHENSDAQVAYDPTRPFDAAATSAAAVPQASAASLADDGLIEVLAADVTAIIASGEGTDQAAHRPIAIEPAVATYQAFETIVDGDARVATDVVADAAGLAGAVAMNNQPVVQAE